MIGSINMLFRHMIKRQVELPLDLGVMLGKVQRDVSQVVGFMSWDCQEIRDYCRDLGYHWPNKEECEFIGQQIMEHVNLDDAVVYVIQECIEQLKLEAIND